MLTNVCNSQPYTCAHVYFTVYGLVNLSTHRTYIYVVLRSTVYACAVNKWMVCALLLSQLRAFMSALYHPLCIISRFSCAGTTKGSSLSRRGSQPRAPRELLHSVHSLTCARSAPRVLCSLLSYYILYMKALRADLNCKPHSESDGSMLASVAYIGFLINSMGYFTRRSLPFIRVSPRQQYIRKFCTFLAK
jgi:hypothetical protein